MEISKNLSERLKSLRKAKKYTQRQVAEGIGMREPHYQRYEYGDRTPRLEQLIALADFYEVSLDYLVGRSDDPERHP